MVASDVDVPAQTDVHQITATQILSCTTFEHSGQALCPLSYAGVSSIRGENNTSSLVFPTRHRKREPSRSSPSRCVWLMAGKRGLGGLSSQPSPTSVSNQVQRRRNAQTESDRPSA